MYVVAIVALLAMLACALVTLYRRWVHAITVSPDGFCVWSAVGIWPRPRSDARPSPTLAVDVAMTVNGHEVRAGGGGSAIVIDKFGGGDFALWEATQVWLLLRRLRER